MFLLLILGRTSVNGFEVDGRAQVDRRRSSTLGRVSPLVPAELGCPMPIPVAVDLAIRGSLNQKRGTPSRFGEI